jgi:hypothetical protein
MKLDGWLDTFVFEGFGVLTQLRLLLQKDATTDPKPQASFLFRQTIKWPERGDKRKE